MSRTSQAQRDVGDPGPFGEVAGDRLAGHLRQGHADRRNIYDLRLQRPKVTSPRRESSSGAAPPTHDASSSRRITVDRSFVREPSYPRPNHARRGAADGFGARIGHDQAIRAALTASAASPDLQADERPRPNLGYSAHGRRASRSGAGLRKHPQMPGMPGLASHPLGAVLRRRFRTSAKLYRQDPDESRLTSI
jgi:hypothetical protein